MSKVSIYENGWIDLVFEGRNKEYGAYQLRQQDSRTTISAFFFGLLFIASISGLGLVLSSFGEKPVITEIENPDSTIHVTKIELPKKIDPSTAIVPLKKENPKKEITKKDLINPVITKSTEPVDEVNTNKEMVNNPQPTVNGLNTETPGTTNVGIGIAPEKPNNNAVNTVSLDKLPEFPGGIKKFYAYVGDNFKNPTVDEEKTIRVYVSFVIEKDGSMTDIQVQNKPGYDLDKEAIRVLKSLKTKWSPGMIGGKAVRTSYNLPITVKME